MNYKDDVIDIVRKKFGYFDYRIWMKDYYDMGYSMSEIGTMVGRTGAWTKYNFAKLNIKSRGRGGKNNPYGSRGKNPLITKGF